MGEGGALPSPFTIHLNTEVDFMAMSVTKWLMNKFKDINKDRMNRHIEIIMQPCVELSDTGDRLHGLFPRTFYRQDPGREKDLRDRQALLQTDGVSQRRRVYRCTGRQVDL